MGVAVTEAVVIVVEEEVVIVLKVISVKILMKTNLHWPAPRHSGAALVDIFWSSFVHATLKFYSLSQK